MGMVEKEFLGYYKTYKDKIFTFFLYRVNFNRAIAEDLTSDIFLKAFKNFDTFDPTRSFQAWIYRIAHNHLCNYYRAQAPEVELEKAQDLCTDFCAQSAASLELDKIIKIIYELEPYHRDVLLLRFVDNLENREIAALLEKDEGAVRTQLSRAMVILREQLKKYG